MSARVSSRFFSALSSLKKLMARVEALEKLLDRILRQKPGETVCAATVFRSFMLLFTEAP
jgi:hypothetical protein